MNEWLKERRRIHNAATERPWVHDEYTGVEGIVYPDTAFAEAVADCGDRDDSAAIVDAHNTLPALLTAVENVLEAIAQIDREYSKAPVRNAYADGMCDAAYMFDKALSEAIEGAIK